MALTYGNATKGAQVVVLDAPVRETLDAQRMDQMHVRGPATTRTLPRGRPLGVGDHRIQLWQSAMTATSTPAWSSRISCGVAQDMGRDGFQAGGGGVLRDEPFHPRHD
jgi:hypothetical protein